MNNQIKKLKKQAMVERQGHGAFGEPEFYEELDVDKFAKLIVRECMTICEDVTERNDPTIACYYAIKEHFGVD